MTKKRPITAEDTYKLVTVSDPQWAPDGKSCAFVKTTMDEVSNSYSSNIMLIPEGAKEPVQYTRSGKDSSPRFTPDAKKLLFVSARKDKPQIFEINLSGGEARQLTKHPNGAAAPAISKDGKKLAFLSPLSKAERLLANKGKFPPPPPESKLEEEKRKLEKDFSDKEAVDPRVYYGLPFKEGTSFVSDKFKHIYTLDLTDEKAKPVRLTKTEADHTPPKWAPNGKFIWSTIAKKPTHDRREFPNVIRIEIKTGDIKTYSREGFNTSTPLPSPDGKSLVCYNWEIKGGWAHVDKLSWLKTSGGAFKDLNAELDRSISGIQWNENGDTLYTLVSDNGNIEIHKFTPASNGHQRLLRGKRYITNFSINANGDILFTASTPMSPTELFILPAGAARPKQLTKYNKPLLDEVVVCKTEELKFKAPDGKTIQGWIIKPDGFDPKKKYPLALNIHDGPHVMWSDSMASMWIEWQHHAARGYVVFYCNPRGSDGYGNEFRTAIFNSWGEADLPDLMAGVEAIVEKGFIDTKRMAITGGSYGGFMTLWTIGHESRFAAAVSQRGVYNLSSFWGTTDIPRLIEDEFDTFPLDDPEYMHKYSPASYVRNVKTPLLLIHSENDFRVPIADAELVFTALKRLNRKVQLVRYPREGHELSRSGEPKHRIDRLNRMVDWFDKYCK